jgi:hypothetical protein
MSSPFDVIAALLGLSEVSLLVKAMRAVDQSAPPMGTDGGSGSASGNRCGEPAARYEPGQVFHPSPRYEPRRAFHPDPRIEPRRHDATGRAPRVLERVVEKNPETLPPEPPWKTLPWENPAQIVPKVKVAVYHPDITRRGLLLDCFI